MQRGKTFLRTLFEGDSWFSFVTSAYMYPHDFARAARERFYVLVILMVA
jgi:hypothetical protein